MLKKCLLNSELMTKALLFCGLPGSGKTTKAKELEREKFTRLSLDDKVFELFGKDPQIPLEPREREAKDIMIAEALGLLRTNKSVILDWGFWKEKERSEIRSVFTKEGFEVELWYFTATIDELLERVKNRNLETNHEITPEMMQGFVGSFEVPEIFEHLINTGK